MKPITESKLLEQFFYGVTCETLAEDNNCSISHIRDIILEQLRIFDTRIFPDIFTGNTHRDTEILGKFISKLSGYKNSGRDHNNNLNMMLFDKSTHCTGAVDMPERHEAGGVENTNGDLIIIMNNVHLKKIRGDTGRTREFILMSTINGKEVLHKNKYNVKVLPGIYREDYKWEITSFVTPKFVECVLNSPHCIPKYKQRSIFAIETVKKILKIIYKNSRIRPHDSEEDVIIISDDNIRTTEIIIYDIKNPNRPFPRRDVKDRCNGRICIGIGETGIGIYEKPNKKGSINNNTRGNCNFKPMDYTDPLSMNQMYISNDGGIKFIEENNDLTTIKSQIKKDIMDDLKEKQDKEQKQIEKEIIDMSMDFTKELDKETKSLIHSLLKEKKGEKKPKIDYSECLNRIHNDTYLKPNVYNTKDIFPEVWDSRKPLYNGK